MVHNHGTEEGKGLACSESRQADGTLKGECLDRNPGGHRMSKPTIGTDEWVHHNPNRFGIYNRALDESGYFSPDGFFQPWSVCQGYDHRGNFDTHAEAIAYLARLARQS